MEYLPESPRTALFFLENLISHCNCRIITAMFSPKFTITNKVLTNIGQVESAKAIIENSPLVPAYDAKFRQEAIVRTVHHGTHIEGNPLEQAEVEKVLVGEDISARDRDIQEILNYRQVLKFIDSKKDEPITQKTLLEIHRLTTRKILKAADSGKYRHTQVAVTNSKTGEISYTPPVPTQISELLRDFLFWLNRVTWQEIHPVIKSAITHYVIPITLFYKGHPIKRKNFGSVT